LKVNVVEYLSFKHDTGGGGLTRSAVFEEGVRRGHDLRFVHILPRPTFDLFDDPDVWLLCDVWNSPWHWRRWWRRTARHFRGTAQSRYIATIDRALRSDRMVHLDNAYVDICDLEYLPCNAEVESESCPYKKTGSPGHRQCFRVSQRPLYDRAQRRYYLSPLHRRTIEDFLRPNNPDRARITPPNVDREAFVGHDGERPIKRLFLGAFVEAKGANEITRRWPNGEVTVIGPPTEAARRYPGYQGAVPYNEVPGLLQRTETLVFLPRWPEPFGRVALEATLSGCHLEANTNVGALSFDGTVADDTIGNNEETIWAALERFQH
jgi:glycosyltransferase involved in cell wall biosynthesis